MGIRDVTLKTVHRPAVKAASAGKRVQRRVRLRQVFGDVGFDASLHGHPVRHGCSGVSGLEEAQKATKENSR